jgi:hypothetical protein
MLTETRLPRPWVSTSRKAGWHQDNRLLQGT